MAFVLCHSLWFPKPIHQLIPLVCCIIIITSYQKYSPELRKQETKVWMMTFPRMPWPAEFQLAREMHLRTFRAKSTSPEQGL
jgi:hypothetical protein